MTNKDFVNIIIKEVYTVLINDNDYKTKNNDF